MERRQTSRIAKYSILLFFGIFLGYNISSKNIKVLIEFRCDSKEKQWALEKKRLRAEVFRLKNIEIYRGMNGEDSTNE